MATAFTRSSKRTGKHQKLGATGTPVARLIGEEAYQRLLSEAKLALLVSQTTAPPGFGDDDLVLVYSYTHQELKIYHYKNLNAVLRGAKHMYEKRLLSYARMLTAALLKLPPVVGLSVRVMEMDAATTAEHQVGNLVKYKAFTSSGDTNWKAQSTQVRLTLMGKTGRYIGGLSRFPDEREVLFLPGTSFLVLAATPNAGRMEYVLEEV